MELNFYKQPFRNEHGSWIYDAKNNFCFQFEINFVENWKKIWEQVMFSLNSTEHEPIHELNLSINPNDPIQILNNGKPFILIRGWGNLTGVGGYNFSEEKAIVIQNDFRDWIIYKLSKK
jgi:hypothetical protein